MKSVSFKNLVSFIIVMLWWRVRRWYGMLVCSGRYGWWRTCAECWFWRCGRSHRQLSWTVRRRSRRHCYNSQDASRDAAAGQGALGRKPKSSRTKLAPHTGCARRLLLEICHSCSKPCERSIRITYSNLLHDDRSIFTWSLSYGEKIVKIGLVYREIFD